MHKGAKLLIQVLRIRTQVIRLQSRRGCPPSCLPSLFLSSSHGTDRLDEGPQSSLSLTHEKTVSPNALIPRLGVGASACSFVGRS